MKLWSIKKEEECVEVNYEQVFKLVNHLQIKATNMYFTTISRPVYVFTQNCQQHEWNEMHWWKLLLDSCVAQGASFYPPCAKHLYNFNKHRWWCVPWLNNSLMMPCVIPQGSNIICAQELSTIKLTFINEAICIGIDENEVK